MEGNQGSRRKIDLMSAIKNRFFLLAALMLAGTAVAGSDAGGGNGATGVVSQKQSGKQGQKSFSLPGLDGVTHRLAEWKGKVVILNFWASWCSSCLYEIRDFVAYQEKYRERGLQIIGIGVDEEDKLRNVQRTLEINYPVLVANPKQYPYLMEAWGNESGVIPFSVVIDRKGQVIFAQHGQIDHDTFIDDILPLLDKT